MEAVTTDAGNAGSREIQAVVFRLGEETYGIEIGFVHEIIRVQPPAALPGTPPAVLGVINLRSRIIPVISLRSVFGGTETEPGPAARIVIVGWNGSRVGLLVDEVVEVRTFDMAEVQPPPPMLSADRHHTVGIARTERGLVALLDIEAAIETVELSKVS